MKYRLKLLIMASVVFCLSLAEVAPADSCLKKLYIDGVKVSEASAPGGLTYRAATGGDRITIGGEGHEWYLYNEYVGKMDEFAVYAGVLSDPCILAHYAAKNSDTLYTAVVQNDNPLLWLRFEDASVANGATALNSGSVTARNGQYIVIGASAGFTTAAGGGINVDSNALVFPTPSADADGSCVSVYDGGEFDYTTSSPGALNGDLTVELWVNFSDINDAPADSDYPRFFQHNGDWNFSGGYGVVLDENSVNLNTGVGVIGGSSVDYNEQPAGDFNNNEWHHVVVTYDSTYVPIATERYPVEVMKDNPALYIRFEEDDPCDYSGNNYWVEASDLVRIEKTMGSFGKAAYLNGGWVAASNTTYEPCGVTDYNHIYAFGPNDLTVEFWLYYPTGAVDSYAGLFSQCDDEDPNYYSPGATRANDGGNQKCRIAFGDNRPGQGGYAYTAEGTWSTDTDNWHHIVVIWDTTQDVNGDPVSTRVSWYTDNVSQKETTYAHPAVSDGVIGPEMDHILFGNLGSRDTPGNVAYTQYMDEIAVYAHCLDRDENGDPNLDRIKAHYEAWDPKSCEEWRDREMWMPAVDINRDCKIDFVDFASFALSWDTCNDPCDANCVPPEW